MVNQNGLLPLKQHDNISQSPFGLSGFLSYLVIVAFLVAYSTVKVQSSTVKHVVSN